MAHSRIRLAVKADVSEISKVVHGAYSHYISRMNCKPAPMETDYTDAVEKAIVWVLQVGQDIAGLIILQDKKDHILVSNVAVATTHQGKGFGKKLLDFADTYTLQKGLFELRLYTNEMMHENLAIYAKLGWIEYDRAEQEGFRRVFMKKQLRAV